MARWKPIAAGVAGFAALAAVGGIWGNGALSTTRSANADNRVVLADVRNPDRQAVARGEYVMRAADCMACHTTGKGAFAGDYVLATPFGTIRASNITPDRETGIGKMTERAFFNAVRHGQGSKGFLYPAMPYTAYTKLTDRDMHDLWAYMATVKPVSNAVDETAGLSFPFSIRLLMAGWNALFFDNTAVTPAAGHDAQWQRGRYLVDAAAHCSACHSPRNIFGAEKASRYLQGGNLGAWFAPDLTSSPHAGQGRYSAADIVAYLGTGRGKTSIATGPMAEAVEHSLQHLTVADLTAIAVYVKSLPAVNTASSTPIRPETPAIRRGALRYEVNCSACHGTVGEGMGDMTPAFAGNRALQSDDATSLIHVMLTGSRAAVTHAKRTGAGMPSFAWKMDDRQIAETLDYIRNTWGNAAKPVDPNEVKRLRSELEAAPTLASN